MSLKICLITPSPKSHRTAEETLALGYLAACLRAAGYTVQVIDGWLEHLSPNEIVSRLSINGSPNMLAFSCYRSNLEQAIEIIRLAKEHYDIPIICGGFGPTFNVELFLKSGFSVVVRGEAEHVIVKLVEAIFNHSSLDEIPGVSYLNNESVINTRQIAPENNLDLLMFPNRDTIAHTITQRNYIHICTSRGCNAHCTYCAIYSFAKKCSPRKRWRGRSVHDIVKEISWLIREYKATHFKIVDDSFLEYPRDINWVREFTNSLEGLGTKIKFRTQVRADRLTPSIVNELARAGWVSTSLGVENFSATALRRMAKSSNREQNLEAIKMLESNGVYVQMGMILFDPDTTMKELEENYQMLNDNPWPITKGIFTEMFAAPGTIFTEQIMRRGLAKVTDSMQSISYSLINHNSRRVYSILKAWQKHNSQLYDWVIDPLTAPKVISEADHKRVYSLYQVLRYHDLRIFREALDHVSRTANDQEDQQLVRINIDRSRASTLSVKIGIEQVYRQNGLSYNAVPNPFLE